MAQSDDGPPRGRSRQERKKLWGWDPIEPPGQDVQSRAVNTTASRERNTTATRRRNALPTTATRNISRPAEHSQDFVCIGLTIGIGLMAS